VSTQAGPAGPARLWRQLSADQKLTLARALWEDEESVSQRVEAVVHIARQMKFRAQYVQKLPAERQIRYLASVPGVSDGVAGRALIVYHLAQKRPMLGAFLDHLGIAHENGLISSHIEPPGQVTLAEAADKLASAYPAEDVHLYLATLSAQDPETWSGLEQVLQQRQAGAGPQT
jgi:hypothetical protein